jgi:ribonuclease BN (tRNA processing enzyme)
MELRVLGSAGAEFPNFRPPSFLIDGSLLLDAGTISSVLTEDEQWSIRNIFITHSHLDHIRSIPALADNIIIKNIASHNVLVHSIAPVISAMQLHMFNNVIWPDFTKLPSPDNPVLSFKTIESLKEYQVEDYIIKAVDVDHTVPAVGYLVTCKGKTIAYTGDTGPTDAFWRYVSGVDVMIVEVSFPDCMQEIALLTKHLTCSLLKTELKKIERLPSRILITHPKPQYFSIIKREVASLGNPAIELLHDGAVFTI